jgi:hypothetical protein
MVPSGETPYSAVQFRERFVTIMRQIRSTNFILIQVNPVVLIICALLRHDGEIGRARMGRTLPGTMTISLPTSSPVGGGEQNSSADI